jgi:ankyrin repeat protein
MNAAYYGLREVADELCIKTDEADVVNDAGMTAVYYAAQNGCLDVVRLLTEHRAG